MSNMELYNKFRSVPVEAQKEIKAGRLKGMTDINPMWRIKMLTEEFGACGTGWYIEIADKWTEPASTGEVVTNVMINLYVKQGGEWSKPIIGVGGSKVVSKESGGLYVNDEGFKMAYTDAISIACKALGMAADIYFAKDRTKYDQPEAKADPVICEGCGKEIKAMRKRSGEVWPVSDIAGYSKRKYDRVLCYDCQKLAEAQGAAT